MQYRQIVPLKPRWASRGSLDFRSAVRPWSDVRQRKPTRYILSMTWGFQVVGGDYSRVGYYILLFRNVLPTAVHRVESKKTVLKMKATRQKHKGNKKLCLSRKEYILNQHAALVIKFLKYFSSKHIQFNSKFRTQKFCHINPHVWRIPLISRFLCTVIPRLTSDPANEFFG